MGITPSRSLPLGRCVPRRSQSPTSSDLLLGSPCLGSPKRSSESRPNLVCSGSVKRPSLPKVEEEPSAPATETDDVDGRPTPAGREGINYEEVDCDVSISSRSATTKAKAWAFKLYDIEGGISQEEMSSVVESICSVIGSSLALNKKSSQPLSGAFKIKLDLFSEAAGEETVRVIAPVATDASPTSATAEKVNPPESRTEEGQMCRIQTSTLAPINEMTVLAPANQTSSPTPVNQIAPRVPFNQTTALASGAVMKPEATLESQTDTTTKSEERAQTVLKEAPTSKRPAAGEVASGVTDTAVKDKEKRTRRKRDKLCSSCGHSKQLMIGEETIIHLHHHQEHTHQHHHRPVSKLTKGQIAETERQAEKSAGVIISTETDQVLDMPKKKQQKRRSRETSHRQPRTLEDVNKDILELYLTQKLSGKCTDFFQFQSMLRNGGEATIKHIHHHHHHTHHHHHHQL